MITSTQLDLLRVGLTEVFRDVFSRPTFYESVFNIKNSDKEYEEYLHIAGFPNLPEWDADGGALNLVEPLQGEKIVFVHKDYGYMWSISKRLMRGDQYRVVASELVRSAGQSALYTVEAYASALIESNPTWADGVSLFGNHPLLGGGSFSNSLSAALSPLGLRDAVTRFRRMVNHRGQPIIVEPKYLIVPPELEHIAKELLNSTIVVNAGGNYVVPFTNVLQGIANLVVNPYFVDPNNWYLFADKSDHRLMFFWREKPSIETEVDFRTKGILNSITMAFSVGAGDWRGLVGSRI